MSTMSPVFQQGRWRWYTDATPDANMVALIAAENTAPTLTGAQMQNGIIRLRVHILETAGVAGSTGALTLQYSQDGTNWQNIEAQSPTAQGNWFRHANGAATDGNTIGTRLLTGGNSSGKYHENGTGTESVPASGSHEVDFAILVHWPPPDISGLRFRITSGGTALPVGTGGAVITFNTSTAADRPNTVAYTDPKDTATSDPETLWYGSNRRVFYDGTRWWVFYVDKLSGTTLRYQNWSGTGAWSAKASTTFSLSGDGIRNQHYLKVIGGTPVVMSCFIRSSSSHRYKRGTISGTTITWGSEGQVSDTVPGTYGAVTCDDGNYWWVAWVDPAGTLYAVRSTNADAGSSWTAGWQTPKSLSDANIGSWAQVALVPLASDKVLVLYHARDTNDLIAVTCTDASGFGTPVIVNEVGATGSAQCNHDDWGVVRSGNYVYVVHTTSASPSTGTYQLKVYSVSGNSWTQGPSPNISMTTGSTDMAPLSYDTNNDKLYLFRTGDGPEGGEDRDIDYETYSGPGDSGSWDNNVTNLAPGGRGNMDAISSSESAAGGKIVVLDTWGDDSLLGTGYAIEYWPISVSTGVNANFNLSTFSQSQTQGALTTSAVAEVSLIAHSQAQTQGAVTANVAASVTLGTQSQSQSQGTVSPSASSAPSLSSHSQSQTQGALTESGDASLSVATHSQTQAQGGVLAGVSDQFALSTHSQAQTQNAVSASGGADLSLSPHSQSQQVGALTTAASADQSVSTQAQPQSQGALGTATAADLLLSTHAQSAVQGALSTAGTAEHDLATHSQAQVQGQVTASGGSVVDADFNLSTHSQSSQQNAITASGDAERALAPHSQGVSQGALSAAGSGQHALTAHSQPSSTNTVAPIGASDFSLSTHSQGVQQGSVAGEGTAQHALTAHSQGQVQGQVVASGAGEGEAALSTHSQPQALGALVAVGTAERALSTHSQVQSQGNVSASVGQSVALFTHSQAQTQGTLTTVATALYTLPTHTQQSLVGAVVASGASDAEAALSSHSQAQTVGTLDAFGTALYALSPHPQSVVQGSVGFAAGATVAIATHSQTIVLGHAQAIVGRLRLPPMWIDQDSAALVPTGNAGATLTTGSDRTGGLDT